MVEIALAIAMVGGGIIGAVLGNARRSSVESRRRSISFRNGWVAGYDQGEKAGLHQAEVLSNARADRIWERIKADIDREHEIPDSVRRSY